MTVCIRYAPRLWEGFGFFGNMCVMIVLLYCTTGYVFFFIVGFLHSLEFHFSICVCDCVCVIVHCLGGCGHLRLQPGKRSQFQCHLQLSRQNGAVPQRRRDPVHPRRHSRFVYLFIYLFKTKNRIRLGLWFEIQRETSSDKNLNFPFIIIF